MRVVDGELVPDPAEYRAVLRAFALRSRGASLRAIAETLAEEGHMPKRSARWHPETLRRLLARVQSGS
jgi:hypothetical protein